MNTSKAKVRKGKIVVEPFDVEVPILIVSEMKDVVKIWNKEIRSKMPPDLEEEFTDGMIAAVVNFPNEKGLHCFGMILQEDVSDSTIVHESFHLLMKIASYKGASWSDDSDEWYAYGLEKIFNDVKDVFNKK